MGSRLVCLLLLSCACALPGSASAQDVDVGISGTALASIQPIDEAYVGGPYLSEGIGGVGPGFGAGVSVMFANGFMAAVEYSTARFTREQTGRLVPAADDSSTTRLHDSLLSFLGGWWIGSGDTRLEILAGASARLDLPTIDGFEIIVPDDESAFPFAPIGGVDVHKLLSRRASLFVSARYAYLDREENIRYLGVGPHVLRVGGGVRVRLN
jgi:hypothetical protein